MAILYKRKAKRKSLPFFGSRAVTALPAEIRTPNATGIKNPVQMPEYFHDFQNKLKTKTAPQSPRGGFLELVPLQEPDSNSPTMNQSLTILLQGTKNESTNGEKTIRLSILIILISHIVKECWWYLLLLSG